MAKNHINPTSDRGLTSKIYKERKKVNSKEPNNQILKMGYRAEQTFPNTVILNGLDTLTEMFNVLSHQGNANQNDPEPLSHINHNG